jgi:hypothetical protein
MFTDCPWCNNRVDAFEAGRHERDASNDEPETRTRLLACPVCGNAHLILEVRTGGECPDPAFDEDDEGFWWPRRIYPDNFIPFMPEVPKQVLEYLAEAEKCLRAGSEDACAVMTGRAVEAVCRHFGAGGSLWPALAELHDRKIIDGRLLNWGKIIKDERNKAAHAGGEPVSHTTAHDLLDFAVAICQYVFVLQAKYERLVDRIQKGLPRPTTFTDRIQ